MPDPAQVRLSRNVESGWLSWNWSVFGSTALIWSVTTYGQMYFANGKGPVFWYHSFFSSSVRWNVKATRSAVTGVPSWKVASRSLKVYVSPSGETVQDSASPPRKSLESSYTVTRGSKRLRSVRPAWVPEYFCG